MQEYEILTGMLTSLATAAGKERLVPRRLSSERQSCRKSLGMLGSKSFIVAFLVVCYCAAVAFARPTVRNVKTHAEFKKLLKHHAEVTGLPVVVDFYSDGCGPCRMVAPHYKKMAEQYKDKAVFAKVDINFNRETASAQMISSMPTFQVGMFLVSLSVSRRADFPTCKSFGMILMARTQSPYYYSILKPITIVHVSMTCCTLLFLEEKTFRLLICRHLPFVDASHTKEYSSCKASPDATFHPLEQRVSLAGKLYYMLIA
jgi:thiol-disulfide isomerase/thioredoxin